MKPALFVISTLGLALLRLRMGQGYPDFLAGWLVVLAFYGEGSRGPVLAAWIGLLHGYPSHSRMDGILALGLYLLLHSQRFHLGRDGWLPRALVTSLTCLVLGLPGAPFLEAAWWQTHARLLSTFGLMTGILSLPLFPCGRRWGDTLGLRAGP